MVVLLSTGVSRYHNCCIDGGTSPEYFCSEFLIQVTDITKRNEGTFEVFRRVRKIAKSEY
jgi:hypothetical protein